MTTGSLMEELRSSKSPLCNEAADSLAHITAERDALRKDAERYRAIRSRDFSAYKIVDMRDGVRALKIDISLDAAIDAAMKEQAK